MPLKCSESWSNQSVDNQEEEGQILLLNTRRPNQKEKNVGKSLKRIFYFSVTDSVVPFFFLGPPGPPGVVIVEEITDTTATLSWSHGVDNHSPITTYNVQARSPVSLGWQTVKTGNHFHTC